MEDNVNLYYIEVLGEGDFLNEEQLRYYLENCLFKDSGRFPIYIIKINKGLNYFEGYRIASTLHFIKEYKEEIQKERSPFDIILNDGMKLAKDYKYKTCREPECIINFLF